MILDQIYLQRMAQSSRMDSVAAHSQILNENRHIYFSNQSYDLFLSHSYLDKTLVYTLVNLFNQAGYSIYVDWMVDHQLDRSMVSQDTAKALRHRMRTCHGLAYISTSNITNSKWCPWELGYMDGFKNGRCAILPILKTPTYSFTGQEYLGLYPYIDYSPMQNTKKYEFWVNDPKNKQMYISLRDWLSGKEPFLHDS